MALQVTDSHTIFSIKIKKIKMTKKDIQIEVLNKLVTFAEFKVNYYQNLFDPDYSQNNINCNT